MDQINNAFFLIFFQGVFHFAEFIFDFVHHIICAIEKLFVLRTDDVAVGIIQLDNTAQITVIVVVADKINLQANIAAIEIAVNDFHDFKGAVLNGGVDILFAHQLGTVFFDSYKFTLRSVKPLVVNDLRVRVAYNSHFINSSHTNTLYFVIIRFLQKIFENQLYYINLVTKNQYLSAYKAK